MTLFIGDVHGKFGPYQRLIRNERDSIQVGDMGVGFFRHSNAKPMPNPPHAKMWRGGHRFIRGNHDNPAQCRTHSQWIKDGTIEGEVMFVGGATSIDKEFRVKGFSWWEDEELSHQELLLMADIYRLARPRIMVTHDCPQPVAEVVALVANRPFKLEESCATRQAFQSMWEYHQPDIWIFGHWHTSFDKDMAGTRFVCLAELEGKHIEVGL